MNGDIVKRKIILNSYPDSIDGNMNGLIQFLKSKEYKDIFSSIYLLPSIYNFDLDRGFSIVNYELNNEFVNFENLKELKELNISLITDFILNHMSINCPQFQDIVENGTKSKYKDFFVDWNEFWKGYGKIGNDGYIVPDIEYTKNMYFRKPGYPVFEIKCKDGSKMYYWNSFYNRIVDENHYLGQMDLNSKSPLVWEFYKDVLKKLKSYGVETIRLDAFPYLSKIVGRRNFFNEPESWDLLRMVQDLSAEYGFQLLPEIHEKYENKTYEKISEKEYILCDYYLPGLIIDAILNKDGSYLKKWGDEIINKNLNTINMLSSHDGIPVKDLIGLLPADRINNFIKVGIERGAIEKKVYGESDDCYQLFTTYYQCLNSSDDAMLLARAIQLFFPGNPQVYYLDLFAQNNNYDAIKNADQSQLRELNRTNITSDFIQEQQKRNVVSKQIELLRFAKQHFYDVDTERIEIDSNGSELKITRYTKREEIELVVNFETLSYKININ